MTNLTPTEIATRQFIFGNPSGRGTLQQTLELLQGNPTSAEYRDAAIMLDAMALACRRAASAVALRMEHEANKPLVVASAGAVHPLFSKTLAMVQP